jgi:hypothetical protein
MLNYHRDGNPGWVFGKRAEYCSLLKGNRDAAQDLGLGIGELAIYRICMRDLHTPTVRQDMRVYPKITGIAT